MLSPGAEDQLAWMRTEIQRYGQSIVPCDQLLVFVSATAPIHAQFGHIFTLAEAEGWSLEFRPDGTVRFAELQTLPIPVPELDQPQPDVSQAG